MVRRWLLLLMSPGRLSSILRLIASLQVVQPNPTGEMMCGAAAAAQQQPASDRFPWAAALTKGGAPASPCTGNFTLTEARISQPGSREPKPPPRRRPALRRTATRHCLSSHASLHPAIIALVAAALRSTGGHGRSFRTFSSANAAACCFAVCHLVV